MVGMLLLYNRETEGNKVIVYLTVQLPTTISLVVFFLLKKRKEKMPRKFGLFLCGALFSQNISASEYKNEFGLYAARSLRSDSAEYDDLAGLSFQYRF
jgi:hypothetical protein